MEIGLLIPLLLTIFILLFAALCQRSTYLAKETSLNEKIKQTECSLAGERHVFLKQEKRFEDALLEKTRECDSLRDALQKEKIKYLQEQLTFEYQSQWWQDYSYLYRHVREWQCEDCQLSFNSDRYYLHVHHRLGTMHNHPKDLRALCIACHSEQPGENHRKLKTTDDYHTFMEKYGPQWCEARKSVESRVRD